MKRKKRQKLNKYNDMMRINNNNKIYYQKKRRKKNTAKADLTDGLKYTCIKLNHTHINTHKEEDEDNNIARVK